MSKNKRTYQDDEQSERLWDIFYGAVAVGTPLYAYRKSSELNELEKMYKNIQKGGTGNYPVYLQTYAKNVQMLEFDRTMAHLLGLTGPAIALGHYISKKK